MLKLAQLTCSASAQGVLGFGRAAFRCAGRSAHICSVLIKGVAYSLVLPTDWIGFM